MEFPLERLLTYYRNESMVGLLAHILRIEKIQIHRAGATRPQGKGEFRTPHDVTLSASELAAPIPIGKRLDGDGKEARNRQPDRGGADRVRWVHRARPNDGRDDRPLRLEARDAEPLDPA